MYTGMDPAQLKPFAIAAAVAAAVIVLLLLATSRSAFAGGGQTGLVPILGVCAPTRVFNDVGDIRVNVDTTDPAVAAWIEAEKYRRDTATGFVKDDTRVYAPGRILRREIVNEDTAANCVVQKTTDIANVSRVSSTTALAAALDNSTRMPARDKAEANRAVFHQSNGVRANTVRATARMPTSATQIAASAEHGGRLAEALHLGQLPEPTLTAELAAHEARLRSEASTHLAATVSRRDAVKAAIKGAASEHIAEAVEKPSPPVSMNDAQTRRILRPSKAVAVPGPSRLRETEGSERSFRTEHCCGSRA